MGLAGPETKYPCGGSQIRERSLSSAGVDLESRVQSPVWSRTTQVPRRGMATEALRTVKDRLSELVDRVRREHDRVTITKNGIPAAVLISPDDLEALEETISILGDERAVRELREAECSIAEGDTLRGVDSVRALRAH